MRELQNGVERAFYSTAEGVLSAQSLSYAIPEAGGESAPARSDSESGEILSALTLCGGDVELAAERLGVSRATLYRHVKRLGIDVKALRHSVSNLKKG